MRLVRCDVEISGRAKKQLRKVPQHVVDKLLAWVRFVIRVGVEEARKIPGYHDEPLKGKHFGKRSIRLSRSYRAIYQVDHVGLVRLVVVEEVSKHGY